MEDGSAGCARGSGLVESSPGFLLDQPNQTYHGETERAQNAPLANRQALRKQAIPPANRWVQAGQGTLSGPRRGGTRAAAHRPGAGGWCGPHPAAGANGFASPPASFHSTVS